MYIAMFGCEQRRDTERRESLEGLSRLGIEPDVIEMSCKPPSSSGNRWGLFEAARRAVESCEAGLLLFEDDVDVADDLMEFVGMAEEGDVLTTFCVMRDRLYPHPFIREAVKAARKNKGFYERTLIRLSDDEVEKERGFFGTQGMYYPRRVLDAVLTWAKPDFAREDGSMHEPGFISHGFDFWLKEHARGFGGIWAAYPNPVQHRAKALSMRGTPMRQQSNSFDLPR